jgi:GNAT superfamily N-acetyltransferase
MMDNISTANSGLDVRFLADHPDLISTLASWFHEEWGSNPEHTVGAIASRLEARLNRDRLPLTLVGFFDGSPVASASLKIQELDAFPEYEHWLGTVYVKPEQRKLGFGKQIILATVERAKQLDVEKLYLYTDTDLIPFYFSLGWATAETSQRNGRSIAVMHRLLKDEQ